MNILVATISAFSLTKKLHKYEVRVSNCDVKEISAYHTNESIIKCISELQFVKESGGISKVLALVTKKTIEVREKDFDNLTALEYYKSIVKECSPKTEIVPIEIENKDTSEILSKICEHIGKDDIVYIDGAGGQRTISNLIQLLTKMLKYIGIKNPCNLYANVQQNQAFISDTSDFDRMTNLADALNEFMTTGKADQLNDCMATKESGESYKELLSVMSEFSDRIRLGNVENIDQTIIGLTRCIKACYEDTSAQDIETVIIRQFLPVIKDKLIGEDKGRVDYAKLVSWCLENMLIQQAMTLFVEKMPKVLFDNKVIVYRGDLEEIKERYQKERNVISPTDWETFVLYTLLMSNEGNSLTPNSSLSSDAPKVNELIDCLRNGVSPKTMDVKKALAIIKTFNNLNLTSASKDKKADFVRDALKTSKCRNYMSLEKTLCNNIPVLRGLLGLESRVRKNDGDSTIQKKFDCISRWKTQTFQYFNFNVSSDLFVKAMYGYLYMKIIRNHTNHASSEDTLTESQKDIFKQLGYKFETSSLKEIRQNIELALSSFKNCYSIEQTQNVKQTEEPNNTQRT